MLVVISVPLKLIIFCDSIFRTDKNAPLNWLKDTLAFLDYIFPDSRQQWSYDYLYEKECFQKNNNYDCGFHVINFIEHALEGSRVDYNPDSFQSLKSRVDTFFTKPIPRKKIENSKKRSPSTDGSKTVKKKKI